MHTVWIIPSLYSLYFSFALEPLLPKKLHTKSQDKLDRDEPERERKEKKKEKRNSKHQEIFDKEMKTTEIPLQTTEAVILSETVLKMWPAQEIRSPLFTLLSSPESNTKSAPFLFLFFLSVALLEHSLLPCSYFLFSVALYQTQVQRRFSVAYVMVYKEGSRVDGVCRNACISWNELGALL